MKMIKSTNTTSTKGVMLISGLAVPFAFLPPPNATPMVGSSSKVGGSRRSGGLLAVVPLRAAAEMILELVQKLARRAAQRRLDQRDLGVQVVECDDGRNRDDEAERRLDQRLGDRGHDAGDAAAAARADLPEGADDADDGAEQPDEGSDGADGGDHVHAAAQVLAHGLFAALGFIAGELDRGQAALTELFEAAHV